MGCRGRPRRLLHSCLGPSDFPPPPRVLRGNREHRRSCAWSLVTLRNGARPLDGVAHLDARWLGVRPELELLRTIVVPHAVSMVNGLSVEQVLAEQVLRHEPVLEQLRPTGGSRMTRCAYHQIASFVPSSATQALCLTHSNGGLACPPPGATRPNQTEGGLLSGVNVIHHSADPRPEPRRPDLRLGGRRACGSDAPSGPGLLHGRGSNCAGK